MRRAAMALVAGVCFTVLLNAGNLHRWSRGTLTMDALNDNGIDERFYFSIIAKAAQGPMLGNSSLLEHRGDRLATYLAPASEGLAARVFRAPLPSVILFFDLLCPFLFILFLAWGLMRFLGGTVPGIGGALLSGAVIGTYFLRAANPQIPLVAAALWLSLVLGHGDRRLAIAGRGVCVGILLWLHVLYGSLALIMEGVLAIDLLLRRGFSWRTIGNAVLAAGLAVALQFPRILLPGPEGALDTFYRRGVLRFHLPTAPSMQLLLILLFAMVLWMIRKRPAVHLRRTGALLLAGIIGLNQAVVHGFDATFISYYKPILQILIVVTLCALAADRIRVPKTTSLLFGVLAAVSLLFLGNDVLRHTQAQELQMSAYEQSAIPEVLDWLRELPAPAVIAAPDALAERIPYETSHYVLFNQYAWNQEATDREIAERYALQATLIPSSIAVDTSYTSVLGQYAGLSAAKARSFCRALRTVLRTQETCDITARSFVRHPELLPMMDERSAPIDALLQRYHVTWIITDENAEGIPRRCRPQETRRGYTLFSCPLS